jgi:hypothetical protein
MLRAMMHPEDQSSSSGVNASAPAAPGPEAIRKAASKRQAKEDALFDKAIVPTLLGSAAVTILPDIFGISIPVIPLLFFVILIGLAGAKTAGATWPRRLLYSVPFVAMTVGVLLGPDLLHMDGAVQVGLVFVFSMIGALPGIALYALVRFVLNRISPP